MAQFLVELCKDNLTYLNLFLFNNNLLVDIRLLLINELIWKKFKFKLTSIDYVNKLFHKIQVIELCLFLKKIFVHLLLGYCQSFRCKY